MLTVVKDRCSGQFSEWTKTAAAYQKTPIRPHTGLQEQNCHRLHEQLQVLVIKASEK